MYANDKIVIMSQNEYERSVNNLWTGILDNQTGMERRYTTMNLSAGLVGKNATDDVPSASDN